MVNNIPSTPWRAPFKRALVLIDSELGGATGWEPIDVDCPTLFYPYRDDTLTSTAALESIRINYMPDEPYLALRSLVDTGNDQFQGYPAVDRGAGFLSAPGRWWIRAEVARIGLLPARRLPVAFVPCPDRALLDTARHCPARPPATKIVFVVGAAPPTMLVSVQELLDGVTSLEIWPAVFSTPTVFRWERSTSSGFIGLANEVYRFSGKNLPLADLYVERTSLPSSNFSVVMHR